MYQVLGLQMSSTTPTLFNLWSWAQGLIYARKTFSLLSNYILYCVYVHGSYSMWNISQQISFLKLEIWSHKEILLKGVYFKYTTQIMVHAECEKHRQLSCSREERVGCPTKTWWMCFKDTLYVFVFVVSGGQVWGQYTFDSMGLNWWVSEWEESFISVAEGRENSFEIF